MGAVGSVVFTLMVGRHNSSLILAGLFAAWVLAPFLGFGLADRLAPRWPVPTRAALYWVMLIVALGSLFIYAIAALGPPRPKPAAVFLAVPLGSWLLAAAVVSLVAVFSRGRDGKDPGI